MPVQIKNITLLNFAFNSKHSWIAYFVSVTGASKSSNYMGTVNRSFKPGNFDSSSDYLKETVLGMPPKRRSRGNTIEGRCPLAGPSLYPHVLPVSIHHSVDSNTRGNFRLNIVEMC